MMAFTRFEEILCWQEAKSLTLSIYAIFKLNKDYSFRDQVQRASVSIMNNIAEGYERKSNKEFKQFLFISKGSAGEVRSMLGLALELKYLNIEQFNLLSDQSIKISRMLSSLISKL